MTEDEAMPLNPYWHGAVHEMFGLTYAAYFVMQRSLLQAMPAEWQEKFVALMEELEQTIDLEQVPQTFSVRACEEQDRSLDEDEAEEQIVLLTDHFRDYRHPPEIPMR